MLYPLPNVKIPNFRSIGRFVFSLEPFENWQKKPGTRDELISENFQSRFSRKYVFCKYVTMWCGRRYNGFYKIYVRDCWRSCVSLTDRFEKALFLNNVFFEMIWRPSTKNIGATVFIVTLTSQCPISLNRIRCWGHTSTLGAQCMCIGKRTMSAWWLLTDLNS